MPTPTGATRTLTTADLPPTMRPEWRNRAHDAAEAAAKAGRLVSTDPERAQ